MKNLWVNNVTGHIPCQSGPYSIYTTRALHAVQTLVCQGPSFYLKFKLKRDITLKLKLSELCPFPYNCILP